MPAQLLDGIATAAEIKDELRVRVDRLKAQGIVPGMGTLLVGDDGASRSYDVDPAVTGVAAWLSPNPGGVGPMTRALLVSNVVECAECAAVTSLMEASA